MYDLQVRPLLLEVLSNQAPMAMGRSLFAAKQAAVGDLLSGKAVFDLAGLHQSQEVSLVSGPVALLLLVGVQHCRGRRKNRQMDVAHLANLAEEELQVVLLRETCQL